MSDTRRPATGTQVAMPTQCAFARRCNWSQVETGISPEAACLEAKRCLQDPEHRCEMGCPVGIPIHKVLEFVQKGWWRKAVNLVREHDLLLGITSLVCPQTEQCEKECVVGRKGNPPVSIGAIERAIWEWERDHGGPQIPTLAPLNGKCVAVVGSGPAGLTAAAVLRVYGYNVVMFEALHIAGGVLMYGIPEFRLPKAVVQGEVEYILSFGGIELVKNTFIGKRYTVAELRSEFDAVFFATGAGKPIPLGIPGEDSFGVMTANEWLTRVNLMHGNMPGYETQIPDFKKIIIFGGGNVAMDSVRSGLRVITEHIQGTLADTSATIAYRRSHDEMPARVQEIHHADEEGARIETLIAPVRILNDGKRVTGVECVRNELGEPDASGRRRPIEIPGSNFILPADLVVTAIGQKPNPAVINQIEGVMVGRGGNIRVDSLGRTSAEGCFAGGDLGRGGATVILATGDGQNAARAIHQWLSGAWKWPGKDEFRPIT